MATFNFLLENMYLVIEQACIDLAAQKYREEGTTFQGCFSDEFVEP